MVFSKHSYKSSLFAINVSACVGRLLVDRKGDRKGNKIRVWNTFFYFFLFRPLPVNTLVQLPEIWADTRSSVEKICCCERAFGFIYRRTSLLADVPHLLKPLRNHILGQGMALPSGKIINREVFQKALDADRAELKLCLKLTAASVGRRLPTACD